MNFVESIDNLYLALYEFLWVKGFTTKKKSHTAERSESFGKSSIYFDNHNIFFSTYSFICKFRIRHKTIQEIRGKINDFQKLEDSETILTSFTSYLIQIGREDLSYELKGDGEDVGHFIKFSDQASVQKWLTNFKTVMNEVGFSFFNSFKTDADFDKWFN